MCDEELCHVGSSISVGGAPKKCLDVTVFEAICVARSCQYLEKDRNEVTSRERRVEISYFFDTQKEDRLPKIDRLLRRRYLRDARVSIYPLRRYNSLKRPFRLTVTVRLLADFCPGCPPHAGVLRAPAAALRGPGTVRAALFFLVEQWPKPGTPGGYPAKTGYPHIFRV